MRIEINNLIKQLEEENLSRVFTMNELHPKGERHKFLLTKFNCTDNFIKQLQNLLK